MAVPLSLLTVGVLAFLWHRWYVHRRRARALPSPYDIHPPELPQRAMHYETHRSTAKLRVLQADPPSPTEMASARPVSVADDPAVGLALVRAARDAGVSTQALLRSLHQMQPQPASAPPGYAYSFSV